MLIDFFYSLRARQAARVGEGIPDAARGAAKRSVIAPSLDDFYYLARMALVKDEQYFDKFDRAVRRVFQRRRQSFDELAFDVPLDWLRKTLERESVRRRKRPRSKRWAASTS